MKSEKKKKRLLGTKTDELHAMWRRECTRRQHNNNERKKRENKKDIMLRAKKERYTCSCIRCDVEFIRLAVYGIHVYEFGTLCYL